MTIFNSYLTVPEATWKPDQTSKQGKFHGFEVEKMTMLNMSTIYP